MQAQQYKPTLSISIPPEQREAFYMALAKLRQQQPFVTKSALVVQAVVDAAQQLEHSQQSDKGTKQP
jgi:hypothetical protein